jgi:ATP-dependent DNA ligase
LPYEVTVLDGVFVGDGSRGTTPPALGAKRFADRLRFVAFDVPVLAGVDPRGLSWAERRSRLELLAEAFELPIQLSPIAERCVGRDTHMTAGPIAGRVIRDRTSTYRDGSRSGWFNVKDRSRYEREAWRSEQR